VLNVEPDKRGRIGPLKQANNMNDPCGAIRPDLPQVV
jgi:hypothetical protein